MSGSERGGLRRPPLRRRPWPAAVAGAAAVGAALAGVGVAGRAPDPAGAAAGYVRPAARPVAPDRPVIPDPPVVAVAGTSRSGVHASVRLISPVTGRLVKVVATVATGNGLAMAPDARSVFMVGLRRSLIVIRQVSVATGRISVVAPGAYPAVSPDGRYLAYAAGQQVPASSFTSLAVRDLRTGRTRTIGLARLIGARSSLLNQGTVSWLGDGTEVLAVPQPDAIATSLPGRVPARQAAASGCGQQTSPRGLCVIVVRIGAHHMSARRVYVPRRFISPFINLIGGDLSAPRSFLIAGAGGTSAGAVVRVSLRGPGVIARRIAPLPREIIPVALAPDGDRLLYVAGHNPPALWVGSMRGGRFTGRHLLFTDSARFGLAAAAW